MSSRHLLLPALFAATMVAGCTRPAPSTDAWVGRWIGPEGTYLEVAGAGGLYEITVMNLDGARTFVGSAQGERIVFERDGKTESVRATDGNGTGMKWLAGKTNCLTVRVGEGYCRD